MRIEKAPKYIDVDGYRYCSSFVPDIIRESIAYKPSSKDIFVVTYPKCGTTWMLQIVMLIVKEGKIPDNIPEYFSSCPFLEMLGPDEIPNIPESGGCIKTHFPYDLVPMSEEAKYIYVARNPRDCCVSFYHHTKHFPGYCFADGTFDDFFELFVEGQTDFNDYFDNLLSWYEHRDDPNVFFVTYEAVKANPKATVKKLAEFLGRSEVAENVELLDEIVEKSSFEYMKRHTNKLFVEMLEGCEFWADSPIAPRGFRAWAKCNADAFRNGQTSFGEFIRNGSVGDTKIVLSEEQEERMNRRIQDKTKGSDVMKLWQKE